MKAIILLSGGMDSTTCLFWAKKRFSEIYAIGFDYGQKHRDELIQAEKIAKAYLVPFKKFEIPNLFGSNSLTGDFDHNEKTDFNQDLPKSFIAGRNLLFLTIAGSYGAEIGVNNIIAGFSQYYNGGLPDCRRSTMDALEKTLSLGIGSGDFKIITPLMNLSKAQTWKMAKDLGIISVIIDETITDYNNDQTGNEWGKGKLDNSASILRAEGFYEAKNNNWI